jgi:hypothetical protein
VATIDDLGAGAPEGFAAWVARTPSLWRAWEACERADWLIWMASRLPRLAESEKRRIVRTALVCAAPERSRLGALVDAVRPTHTPAEVAAIWGGRRAPIDGGDWIVILTLASLTALPLLFVRSVLWWLVGVLVCVPLWFVVRRASLAPRLAAMTWERAIAIALQEVQAGVAAAGPRRRAAQAVVVRETLSFVRARLAAAAEEG